MGRSKQCVKKDPELFRSRKQRIGKAKVDAPNATNPVLKIKPVKVRSQEAVVADEGSLSLSQLIVQARHSNANKRRRALVGISRLLDNDLEQSSGLPDDTSHKKSYTDGSRKLNSGLAASSLGHVLTSVLKCCVDSCPHVRRQYLMVFQKVFTCLQLVGDGSVAERLDPFAVLLGLQIRACLTHRESQVREDGLRFTELLLRHLYSQPAAAQATSASGTSGSSSQCSELQLFRKVIYVAVSSSGHSLDLDPILEHHGDQSSTWLAIDFSRLLFQRCMGQGIRPRPGHVMRVSKVCHLVFSFLGIEFLQTSKLQNLNYISSSVETRNLATPGVPKQIKLCNLLASQDALQFLKRLSDTSAYAVNPEVTASIVSGKSLSSAGFQPLQKGGSSRDLARAKAVVDLLGIILNCWDEAVESLTGLSGDNRANSFKGIFSTWNENTTGKADANPPSKGRFSSLLEDPTFDSPTLRMTPREMEGSSTGEELLSTSAESTDGISVIGRSPSPPLTWGKTAVAESFLDGRVFDPLNSFAEPSPDFALPEYNFTGNSKETSTARSFVLCLLLLRITLAVVTYALSVQDQNILSLQEQSYASSFPNTCIPVHHDSLEPGALTDSAYQVDEGFAWTTLFTGKKGSIASRLIMRNGMLDHEIFAEDNMRHCGTAYQQLLSKMEQAQHALGRSLVAVVERELQLQQCT